MVAKNSNIENIYVLDILDLPNAKKLTKEILKPLGLNPRDYFYGVDYVAKYENDVEYLGIGDEGAA